MYITRIYQDDPRLEEFMSECNARGFNNNSSIKDMKFDYFEHSAFYAYIVDEKIKLFSGVHNFDFEGERYWRVGFRSVSLYDDAFKPIVSRNWRKASIHVGAIYTLQMKWVEDQFGPSKFVITSNDNTKSKETAGTGHSVDKALKNGRLSGSKLLLKEIEYLYTIQNVWLIDQSLWYKDFDNFYTDIKVL